MRTEKTYIEIISFVTLYMAIFKLTFDGLKQSHAIKQQHKLVPI